MPLFSKNIAELKDPRRSALYEGTVKGLQCLLDNLEGNIPKLFFLEGRAAIYLREIESDLLVKLEQQASVIGLHGMDHEDLEGSESKVALSLDEGFEILANGVAAIQNAIGAKPRIFRAPYMRISHELLLRLPQLEIEADSSLYLETTTAPVPYLISNQSNPLWEIPVVKYPEASQKILYLYLWPLFERKRTPEDYIYALRCLSQNEGSSGNSGVCMVNLHPWHLAYSITERRYFSNREVEDNILLVNHIITELFDQAGIEFCMPAILEEQ
ncbi:MAG: polysaccharide deacetylase family protein [Candidatus Heimdallarchaeota archaeon]